VRGTHSLSRTEQARDLSGWQDKASEQGALTNCQEDREIEPVIKEYSHSIKSKGKELPGKRNIMSE
jgi:hypothetical protein